MFIIVIISPQKIHNKSVFKGPTGIFRAVHLVHYGYDLTLEQTQAKAKRTIGLLKESLEEDPHDYESYFYLAQAYGSYLNDIPHTLKYCKIYMDHKKDLGKEFNSSIYHLAIFIHLSLKDYKNALDIINLGLSHDSLDLDILFDWIKYGIETHDPKIIAIASQRFVIAFQEFPKLRLKTSGRFYFNYNLTSYANALYFLSISYLENGVIELGKLKDLFPKLESNIREELKKNISENLSKLKIKGLLDDPKIITDLNGINSMLQASPGIKSL